MYYTGNESDLTVVPADATATWAINGANHGISYGRNSNTGFIAVPGVTVYEFYVPPTGIADISAAIAAMLALFAVSAVLWGVALRRK